MFDGLMDDVAGSGDAQVAPQRGPIGRPVQEHARLEDSRHLAAEQEVRENLAGVGVMGNRE